MDRVWCGQGIGLAEVQRGARGHRQASPGISRLDQQTRRARQLRLRPPPRIFPRAGPKAR